MRHYNIEDYEGENESKGFSGKYAIRRDIARNGKSGAFQKPKKENHKPRPPRHLENPVPENFKK